MKLSVVNKTIDLPLRYYLISSSLPQVGSELDTAGVAAAPDVTAPKRSAPRRSAAASRRSSAVAVPVATAFAAPAVTALVAAAVPVMGIEAVPVFRLRRLLAYSYGWMSISLSLTFRLALMRSRDIDFLSAGGAGFSSFKVCSLSLFLTD